MKRRQVDDIAREAWREIAESVKDKGDEVKLEAHNAYSKTVDKVKSVLSDEKNYVELWHLIVGVLAALGIGFMLGKSL